MYHCIFNYYKIMYVIQYFILTRVVVISLTQGEARRGSVAFPDLSHSKQGEGSGKS